jgi:hypothetical protein
MENGVMLSRLSKSSRRVSDFSAIRDIFKLQSSASSLLTKIMPASNAF